MQRVPGTAPPSLPEVVSVRVSRYKDSPHFNETSVTRGGEYIVISDIVLVGFMEALDYHPPVVKRSQGGTQGTGHTCCIILQVSFMLSLSIPHRKRQGFILNHVQRDIDRQKGAQRRPDLHGLEPVPRTWRPFLDHLAACRESPLTMEPSSCWRSDLLFLSIGCVCMRIGQQ